ncbi:MAG: hypothetical protein KZQ64_04990, partial [gamma proteobacterium symbiont of Bathyaustriella thionipta]|nr:hypothetical protein [gamma proteobacterium symbiont of Bathyaustriella thionipta]
MNLITRFLLFFLLLSPALTWAQDTIETFLNNAQQSISNVEFKTALIHLKNAAQKDPDNIKIRLAFADLYVQIGYGSQAAIEIDKAEFLGANKKETQLLRIKSQLIQGKFAEVTSQISEILNVETRDIGRIRALQGQAYLNQGNIEKARSYFLRGSRLAPDTL